MKTTACGLWAAFVAAGVCVASASGAERSLAGGVNRPSGQHSPAQKTAGLRDGMPGLPVPRPWQWLRPRPLTAQYQQRQLPPRQSERYDDGDESWQPDNSRSRMSGWSMYDPSDFNLRQQYSGNCPGGRCNDTPYSTFSNRPYVPYDTNCPSGRCGTCPQGRCGRGSVPDNRSGGMTRPWSRSGDPGDLRIPAYRY